MFDVALILVCLVVGVGVVYWVSGPVE